ncbi:MAG: class I SAM-dependent methyltransferase [Thermoguttaceae bacterium]|jgi:23S rRNA (cytosine1962-C5)-methyltransferase|nr:class I SAM-dependent methyltransferase [Thermoguttaceae bacterium]
MLCPEEYQLLDFGEGRRLERFGRVFVDRPCPVAEAVGKAEPALWPVAEVRFDARDAQQGDWTGIGRLPHPWILRCERMAFELRTTPLGQVGLFPEQADNWRWICEQLESGSKPGSSVRLLNLFAYTGGSTLAAAAAGAEVVHVDAARNIVAWARRNAQLSGLETRPIHWIVEDARKFVRRELRRGSRYDAVILDPPSYGHGRRGEVWRLSKHLAGLLAACAELTGGCPRFLLLTCHTPGFGPERLGEMTRAAFGAAEPGVMAAEPLTLASASGRLLPAGAAVRWHAAEKTTRAAKPCHPE